jgi:hypothetical protein
MRTAFEWICELTISLIVSIALLVGVSWVVEKFLL